MKTGKTLTELAQELDRQQNSKRDFVVDTRKIEMESTSQVSELMLQGADVSDLTVNDNAHNQIGSRLKIPAVYYNRLRKEHPQLLDQNVNGLFQAQPEQRMVRTLDGKARAFLSNRYQPLDNYDLAQAVLPILATVPDMKIESCEMTESRMYIKAIFPRIEAEVSKGDVVQSGIVISNSEIGMGSLKVEPLIFRLVCLNGMISADYSQRKYHVGRAKEENMDIYTNETIAADNKATWLKMQDTVKAAIDTAKFEMIVEAMRKSKSMIIEAAPMDVVERVQKTFQFNDDERDGILTHLLTGGDLTGYGLLNAITRTAQDVDSYDRSTDMERIGGQIITLNTTEWQRLAA